MLLGPAPRLFYRLAFAVARSDWKAPVATESSPGNADTGRCLPPLILVSIDHGGDATDDLSIEAAFPDLARSQILLDIVFEHRVELLVRRQRVGV